MNYVAVNKDGQVVHKGDEVVDFRGTPADFVRASRLGDVGHDGKVEVERDGRKQEYYARVFGLTVREA